MRYLNAIQRLPGNTASEKLSWIGRLASHHQEAIQKLDQLPPELLPILKVEVAVKNKKYEDIVSALKSDDSSIVTRALKASWFFDGNHTIVNVEYFCKNVFPYVSQITRIRIMKTLARRMKNPEFAKQMFATVRSAYGLKFALPLITSCDENFVCEEIIKKTILPPAIFEKIFRRNFDLGVRLLKSLIQDYEEYLFSYQNPVKKIYQHYIVISYNSFLFKLAKHRPMDFVDLIEEIKFCPNIKVMSNTCARRFLKEAQHRLAENPHLYMPVLPPKIIAVKQMEIIFPGLMEHYSRASFNTDIMLSYLKNYPEETRLELLCKTYRDLYHGELLDNMANVTPTLLRLLPVKRRKAIAIKMMKIHPSHNTMAYETAWICYFPLKMAISFLKLRRARAWNNLLDKLGFHLQMIYTCNVNKDENKLFDILKTIANKEYIESNYSQIFDQMVDNVVKASGMPHLSKENGSLVCDIVQLFYEKFGYVKQHILEDILHFRLIHNMPITDLIDVLLETDNFMHIEFNMLKDYPHYERQYLLTFVDTFRQQGQQEEQRKEELKEQQIGEQALEEQEEMAEQQSKLILRDYDAEVLCKLVIALYDFNNRCKVSHTKIERLTIKDQPWLMDAISAAMHIDEEFNLRTKTRSVLRKQESDLYRNWFVSNISTNVADVTSGAALRLLKTDPQSVLDNWEEYLTDCMRNHRRKHVKHFVRAVRWYNDIPVKFAERCLTYLYEEDTSKVSSALIILSILFRGDTLTKLIKPLISMENTGQDVRRNSELSLALTRSMGFSNPPVSLNLVAELLEGTYASVELMMSVCKRCLMVEVISFMQNFPRVALTTLKIVVQKQWTPLVDLFATLDIADLLFDMWTAEEHETVRTLLFGASQRLFRLRPQPETWSLCCKIVSTLTPRNERLLFEMAIYSYDIPDKYVEKFFDLWLNTIEKFTVMGLDAVSATVHVNIYLIKLDQYIGTYLSAEYVDNMFERFLYHGNANISQQMKLYMLSILNRYKTRLRETPSYHEQ